MSHRQSDANRSAFLRPVAESCPDDFLALAAGCPQRPMAFVRAIGAATLQTARDAAAAGLATPLLVGEAAQITADAAAVGCGDGRGRREEREGLGVREERGEQRHFCAGAASLPGS